MISFYSLEHKVIPSTSPPLRTEQTGARVVANVSVCLSDHIKCTGSYIDLTGACLLNCLCKCHSKDNVNFERSKEQNDLK
jgi:hypothetical protein